MPRGRTSLRSQRVLALSILVGVGACEVQRIDLFPLAPYVPSAAREVESTPAEGGAPPEISVEAQGGARPVVSLGGDSSVNIIEELPDGFVGDAAFGGWRVVESPEQDVEEDKTCANILRAVVRDFRAGHPDFQVLATGLYPGIVGDLLGADQKPILRLPDDPDDQITSAETFNEWYRNVDGTNLPFVVELWLEPEGETFVFDSSSFFPLASLGYADIEGGFGQDEGFHFTTELHTTFVYQGGEEFKFRGDDDVWVFINGKLAIDIGGVHGALADTVLLDDIATNYALEHGNVYTLDLFQAERRTTHSNFRIETTFDFTDCGKILPADLPVR